ncbi:MAG: acyl-CoA synthetase [Alphaproteobacteria bacterium]
MMEEPIYPFTTRTSNLAHYICANAARLPDHHAMIWGDKSWSWSLFWERVGRIAAILKNNGIEKGDRILIQSTNCNQMFEAMFASFAIGAVWVPANFRGMPKDLAWMAELSKAKLLICHEEFPEHAAIKTPWLQSVLAIGGSSFGPNIETLMKETAPDNNLEPVDRDDPAWLFFTSGTSGKPKAGTLTHGQLHFIINNHLCDLTPGINHRDASLVVAPLSHGAGIHQLMISAKAAPTVLTSNKKFDTAEIWSLIEKWKITNMFTVPTILKLIVEAPEAQASTKDSLRYIIYAGAPMFREDQRKAIELLGPVLVQYYGLGEVTGAITVLPPEGHAEDQLREGSCGYPRTGVQISIRDEQGQLCADMETGEICVLGPSVFAGYWDNPEANQKSFHDGWFRTGDIGHLDKNGYLYITGRASDMYISGGSNIHPREIEEKILEHEAINEVAVFGIPDAKWGEIGVAVCKYEKGKTVSAEALEAFIRQDIAGYKIPREFYFWEEIPKSGYGKLAKRLIRDELLRRKDEN